jgi:hypothetical protein
MLDARIRPLIDPALNAVGSTLAARSVTANTVTLVGLGIGALAAACNRLWGFLDRSYLAVSIAHRGWFGRCGCAGECQN